MIPLYSRVYLCQCCNLQYLWISHIPTHSDLVGCLQMVGYMFPPPLHHVWDLNYRLTWSMYYINPCISGNTCTITIVSKILSWSHCQYSFPSSNYLVLSHSHPLASSHTTLIYSGSKMFVHFSLSSLLWVTYTELGNYITVCQKCLYQGFPMRLYPWQSIAMGPCYGHFNMMTHWDTYLSLDQDTILYPWKWAVHNWSLLILYNYVYMR